MIIWFTHVQGFQRKQCSSEGPAQVEDHSFAQPDDELINRGKYFPGIYLQF